MYNNINLDKYPFAERDAKEERTDPDGTMNVAKRKFMHNFWAFHLSQRIFIHFSSATTNISSRKKKLSQHKMREGSRSKRERNRGRERKKKWLEWKMHCTCSVACIHDRPSEWLWLWIHLTRAHTALAHIALKNWREIVEKHSSIVCSCTELCTEQFHGFMPCRMDGLRHLISIHPWQSQR